MKNRTSRLSLIHPSFVPRPSQPLPPPTLPAKAHSATSRSQPELPWELLLGLEQHIQKERSRPQRAMSRQTPELTRTKWVGEMVYPQQLVKACQQSNGPALSLKGVVPQLTSVYYSLRQRLFLWTIDHLYTPSFKPPVLKEYRSQSEIQAVSFGTEWTGGGRVNKGELLMGVGDVFGIRIHKIFRINNQIFLQNLYITIDNQGYSLHALHFAHGRLFAASADGELKEVRRHQRDLLRLKLWEGYEVKKAQKQSLFKAVWQGTGVSQLKESLKKTFLSETMQFSEIKSCRKTKTLVGLLNLKVQSINPLKVIFSGKSSEQQRELVVYGLSNHGLVYAGSITNETIQKLLCERMSLYYRGLSVKINSFSMQQSDDSDCRLVVYLQTLERVSLKINCDENGPIRPLVLSIVRVSDSPRLLNKFGTGTQTQLTLLEVECEDNQEIMLLQDVRTQRRRVCLLLAQKEGLESVSFFQNYSESYSKIAFLKNHQTCLTAENHWTRQVHLPAPIVVLFGDSRITLNVRLRELDQIVYHLLKLAQSKRTPAQLKKFQGLVSSLGQLNTCASLLAILCDREGCFWISDSIDTKVQAYQNSIQVREQAAIELNRVGSKLISKSEKKALVSVRNEAILLYLARILVPLWNSPVFLLRNKLQLNHIFVQSHRLTQLLSRLIDFISGFFQVAQQSGKHPSGFLDIRQSSSLQNQISSKGTASVMEERQFLKNLESLATQTKQALLICQTLFTQQALRLLELKLWEISESGVSLNFGQLFFQKSQRVTLGRMLGSFLSFKDNIHKKQFQIKFSFYFDAKQFQFYQASQLLSKDPPQLTQFLALVAPPLPHWLIDKIAPHALHAIPLLLRNYAADQTSLPLLLPTLSKHLKLVKEGMGCLPLNLQSKLMSVLGREEENDYREQAVNLLESLIQSLEQGGVRLPYRDLELLKLKQQELSQTKRDLQQSLIQADLYLFRNGYNFLLGLKVKHRSLEETQASSAQLIATLQKESGIGDSSIWPLPALFFIKKFQSSIAQNAQLLKPLIYEIENVNMAADCYMAFRGELLQTLQKGVTSETDFDPQKFPFWLQESLRVDLGLTRSKVFQLYLDLLKSEFRSAKEQAYTGRNIYFCLALHFLLAKGLFDLGSDSKSRASGRKLRSEVQKGVGELKEMVQALSQQSEGEEEEVLVELLRVLF